jgi:hypothetical protein
VNPRFQPAVLVNYHEVIDPVLLDEVQYFHSQSIGSDGDWLAGQK